MWANDLERHNWRGNILRTQKRRKPGENQVGEKIYICSGVTMNNNK